MPRGLAVNIRRAQRGDEGSLALVAQAAFLEAFAGVLPGANIIIHCQQQLTSEKFGEYLINPDALIWLAEAIPGGAPVGYLLVTPPHLPLENISPTDREIKRIYILHRYQKEGIGGRLMAEARGAAQQEGWGRFLLGVYKGKESALAFYRRHKFQDVGVRKFQVGNDVYDDLILALTLEA